MDAVRCDQLLHARLAKPVLVVVDLDAGRNPLDGIDKLLVVLDLATHVFANDQDELWLDGAADIIVPTDRRVAAEHVGRHDPSTDGLR